LKGIQFMKKLLLFTLTLIGTISAWGGFEGSCEWKITESGTYDGSSFSRSGANNFIVVAETSGTVTIKNANFSNTKGDNSNWGVVGVYGGTLILENCTIHNYGTGIGAKCASGSLVLRNCTIYVDNYRGYASAAVQVQSGKSNTVSIEGGLYESVGTCVEIMSSGGTVSVSGGTFNCKADKSKKPYNYSTSEVGYYGALYVDADGSNETKKGKVTITDGNFNGYLYIRNSDHGTISPEGGTFNETNIYKSTSTSNKNPTVYDNMTIPSLAAKANKETYLEDNAGVITNKVVDDAPADYVRNVTSGNWGTIALSNKAVVTGATLYKIINKASDDSYIELEEVEASSVLPADMPFIYQASGTQLKANYSEATAISAVANGLVASPAAGLNWPTKAASFTELTGKYLIANEGGNGKLVLAANGSALAPYRAYVDMSNIEDLTATPVQGRRIIFGQNGTTVATAIDAVSAESAKAEKVMLNGKLYIRRGAQLFDAQGALVK